MNNLNTIIVGVLFIVVCSPSDALPADHAGDNCRTQQTQNDTDRFRACLDLQDTLLDKERSQALLRDRTRIRGMLELPELRQEILQHPRFIRQMMQVSEMRQELLHNEQMMHEMLRDRDIHSEITRNREMVEEIEKNETYRQLYQEQEAGILEDLLLESPGTRAPSTSHGH